MTTILHASVSVCALTLAPAAAVARIAPDRAVKSPVPSAAPPCPAMQ